jgi:segregation and condensation protein A
MATAPDSYQIHLPQFEGPFDLLLFFIQRDELNVYDIPISKITSDFLVYIRAAEERQIELGAEFMLMAAELMRVKAQMLLPRPKVDADGNPEDPRMDLVERLLQYKQYREASERLDTLASEREQWLPRGYVSADLAQIKTEELPQDELFGLNLYQILQVYQKLIQKAQTENARPRHVIQRYPYTPEEVKKQLRAVLDQDGRVDFIAFVMRQPDRMYLVFSFLAVLELVQFQVMRVHVTEGFNNFYLLPYELVA